MEKSFPSGKRPPCYWCNVTKPNSLYFWQKIGKVIRFFCLGCLDHVSEGGVIDEV